MSEKVIILDHGNYKILPGTSMHRVKEMLVDINKRLENTSNISEHACMELYCIWYEATHFIQEM